MIHRKRHNDFVHSSHKNPMQAPPLARVRLAQRPTAITSGMKASLPRVTCWLWV